MITENELHEFEGAIFTGVTVGIGSLVLLFSSGTRILIQCPFRCEKKNSFHVGHGEDISTSNLLFSYLNQRVELCSLLDGEILKLFFGNESNIYIVPESNGFESYVITTSQGDYPVIAY